MLKETKELCFKHLSYFRPIIDKYKIPVEDRDPAMCYVENGGQMLTFQMPGENRIAIDYNGKTVLLHAFENLWAGAHELAHWLLAPPSFKELPNYGLGITPRDRTEIIPDQRSVMYIGKDEADIFEDRARLLTLMIIEGAGLPTRIIADELTFENIIPTVIKHVEWLKGNGFVTKLTPEVLDKEGNWLVSME